jgi:hypothetical protein
MEMMVYGVAQEAITEYYLVCMVCLVYSSNPNYGYGVLRMSPIFQARGSAAMSFLI